MLHSCSALLDPCASASLEQDWLQELSLAGNTLTELPACIGNLTQLQKLQISGNRLSCLPDSIGSLSRLEVGLSQLPNLAWP